MRLRVLESFLGVWLQLAVPARLVAAALLATIVAGGIAAHRGVGLGLAALAVYGAIFVSAAVRPEADPGWARRHPFLDTSLMAPLTFFAAAGLTDLPLLACAAIGIAGWLVTLALALRRRTGTPA